jgi:Flp pilus assembly pilin Flp
MDNLQVYADSIYGDQDAISSYGEVRKQLRGQTMTEYALILAAVAIVVVVTYEVMSQDIGSTVDNIDTALTPAKRSGSGSPAVSSGWSAQSLRPKTTGRPHQPAQASRAARAL